jgi:hypothetical protein
MFFHFIGVIPQISAIFSATRAGKDDYFAFLNEDVIR